MILDDGNLSSQLSTGNRLIDALGGGIYGLANATQRKGQYVPMFNWQGNGIARGGLQYLANPDYTNMYDTAQAASASFSGDRKGSSIIDSLRQRFQRDNKPMFQLDTIYKYPLNTQEYKMPQLGNVGGNTIGGTQGAYDNMYALPTRQISFKLPWE